MTDFTQDNSFTWFMNDAHTAATPVSPGSPLPVTATVSGATFPAASTTGGASTSFAIMANTTNSTLVSAGAHTVYSIQVFNNASTIAYLKLYDKATAPTVGTDTPVWVGMVPANSGGAGFAVHFPAGMAFTLGLGYGMTTGIANSDTGSVAATTYIVDISYK